LQNKAELASTPLNAGRGRRLRICLAASGGGHLRQLLDLEPVWGAYDHFFVTEKIALGESVAREHRVHFVDHYSFGQIRWGQPLKMLRAMISNLVQSIRLLRTEKPDIIITTGAGAVFWTALLGRLSGKPLILIESFARFDGPSKFGRMVKPFATDVVVQSPKLKADWPDALVFDPFKRLDTPRAEKQRLIFATVGATLPFDRLTQAVLDYAREHSGDRLIVQTGVGSRWGSAEDESIQIVETLDFGAVKSILRDADVVITHGGTGSLITALREGCRVVAMPRRFEYREHYDDHQSEIVRAFEQRGLIEVALEADDLAPAIARVRSKEPPVATTDPSALLAWLGARVARVGAKAS
jgi:UDP-N-acetylglucosamine transferase subunit ALG13